MATLLAPTAFAAFQAAGGAIYTADVNAVISNVAQADVNSLIAGGCFTAPTSAHNLTVGNITITSHQYDDGGADVVGAAGANNGTSPPAPVMTGCRDGKGKITFGSGGTAAAGAQVVVTFTTAYASAPIVVLTAGNTATQALGLYASSVTTTGFTVSTTSAPTSSQANTVYVVNYVVVQ
jgi:hypothetical protein